MKRTLKLGTRGSLLARAQSQMVADQLSAATGWPVELVILTTRGDLDQQRPLAALGGKGLFTFELEEGLRDGSLDLAVHSLKDLPTEDADGLTLGAIPEREDPRDVIVGAPLSALPVGAHLGTGSLRRRVQALALRPDLRVGDIRGNVETRLRKRDEGQFDATILAAAGLNRLGIRRADGHPIAVAEMVPAVGQGALAVQCRAGDPVVLALLAQIDHAPTRAAVGVERAFLQRFGGGCNTPAACHAWSADGELRALAVAPDPSGGLRRAEGSGLDGQALGRRLAAELRQG
ncbi:MAG: hydroxymethylbilane synthase [Deltaproteobacteria bacterium]|nr:hydroxymethylbilane synthase [Deltaproteobacteria bacterium]